MVFLMVKANWFSRQALAPISQICQGHHNSSSFITQPPTSSSIGRSIAKVKKSVPRLKHLWDQEVQAEKRVCLDVKVTGEERRAGGWMGAHLL